MSFLVGLPGGCFEFDFDFQAELPRVGGHISIWDFLNVIHRWVLREQGAIPAERLDGC